MANDIPTILHTSNAQPKVFVFHYPHAKELDLYFSVRMKLISELRWSNVSIPMEKLFYDRMPQTRITVL